MNYWRLQKTALHPCPVCLKNISKRMTAIWRPSSELSGCVRPRNHRWQLKWSARFFCTSVTAVDSAAHILNRWRTNGAGSFDLGPFLGPRLLSHRAVCGDRGLASAGWHAAEPRDPIARGSERDTGPLLTGDTGPLCGCLEFVLPHLCLTTPKPQAKPAWHRRTYPSPNPLCFLRPESYY